MKKIIFFSFCFMATLTLTGCGAKQENGGPEGARMLRQRQLDFGQPESAPSLSGIVKSIVGNEVTVLKIERPAGQMGEGGRGQAGAQGDTTKTQEKKTSASLGASPMGGPGMGGPGMSGGRRDATDEEKTSMIAMFKEMSTGEEKITIPVGIRMLKSEASEAREPKMVAATLEDIKQDSMLTIWLDESIVDRKIAKFVVIK